ncbi:MAG: anaerobic ribonucleoside-triphosphate reductase activating protein [Firmicutes bacterium]|nr:anaerobic ribonucleoside-triphosphate reductase activating protein [Bacillota bacterium]
MDIRGLQRTSLIDFPGEICATLFTGGCNLRCCYCYNKDLVFNPDTLPFFSQGEIMSFLQKRSSLLDGICLTGGEPTLQKALLPFLTAVKELGLKVKLDTNGTRPAVLRRLLEKEVLDYVAVDLKGPWQKYPLITGKNIDVRVLKETIALLKDGSLQHEFRTTVVPGILGVEDLLIISKTIEGSPKYVLQQFQPHPNLIDSSLCSTQPYSLETIQQAALRCRQYVQSVELRGF